ncbi:MAG TPA: hypothetical protein VK463_12135 [Desulfomonilaceae bacterium]|nr:hypothetical protein [Desulfomonilaceae bacterium]
MAGKQFLNPYLKIVLSLMGAVAIGYQLYVWLGSGEPYDNLTVIRALVFAGFAYLLVQSCWQALYPDRNS